MSKRKINNYNVNPFDSGIPTGFYSYTGDYNDDFVHYIKNRDEIKNLSPTTHEIIWLHIPKAILYHGGAQGYGQFHDKLAPDLLMMYQSLIELILQVGRLAKYRNNPFADVKLIHQDLPGASIDLNAEAINYVGYALILSQRKKECTLTAHNQANTHAQTDSIVHSSFNEIFKDILNENDRRIMNKLNIIPSELKEEALEKERRDDLLYIQKVDVYNQQVESERQRRNHEKQELSNYNQLTKERNLIILEENEEAKQWIIEHDLYIDNPTRDENGRVIPFRPQPKRSKFPKLKRPVFKKPIILLEPIKKVNKHQSKFSSPPDYTTPAAYHVLIKQTWPTTVCNYFGYKSNESCMDSLTMMFTENDAYGPDRNRDVAYFTTLMNSLRTNDQMFELTTVFNFIEFVRVVASMKPNTDQIFEKADNYVVFEDSSSYDIATYRFPLNGRFTYLIRDLSEFGPDNWKRRLFPYTKSNFKDSLEQREHYIQQHDSDIYKKKPWAALRGEPRHLSDINHTSAHVVAHRLTVCSEEELERKHDEEINRKPRNIKIYDIEQLKINHSNKIKLLNENLKLKSLDLSPDDLLQYKYDEMRRIQIESITEYENNLFYDGSNSPPSIIACITHIKDHLTKNINLCHTRKAVNINLSPLGDFLSTFVAALETVFAVNTVHTDVIKYFISCLHVFLVTPEHLHTLKLGPPTSNKSHVLKLLMLMLIINTFRELTFASPKSKTGTAGDELNNPAADKIHDMLVELHDDIRPAAIGANSKGANGKSAETSGCDEETIIRAMLTQGCMNYSALVINENGERVTVTKTIHCRSLILANTNELQKNVAPAMGSRFDMIVDTIKIRLDNNDIFGVMNLINDENAATMKDETIAYMKLLQARVAIHCQLIYAGILKPITTIASDTIATHLDKIAQDYVLNSSKVKNIRNYQRICKMMCPILCILESQLICFDSELSQLRHRNFKLTDYITLQKFHYTTIEHACIALGMYKASAEDQIVGFVLLALKSYIESEAQKQYIERMKSKRDNNVLTIENNTSHVDHIALKLYSITQQIKKDYTDHNLPIPVKLLDEQIDCQDAFNLKFPLEERGTMLMKAQKLSRNPQLILPEMFNQQRQYECISCTMNSKVDNGLFVDLEKDSKEKLIEALAIKLMLSMNPIPTKDSIIDALNLLTQQMIHVPLTNNKNETQDVPSLTITHSELRMPVECFHYVEEGRLYNAVRRILNHKGAHKGDYIFGTPDEDIPYLYSIIKVHENGINPDKPNEQPYELTINNPYYRDPSVVKQTLGMLSIDSAIATTFSSQPIIHLNPINHNKESDTYNVHGLDEYAYEINAFELGLTSFEKGMLPPGLRPTLRYCYQLLHFYHYQRNKKHNPEFPKPYPINNDWYVTLKSSASKIDRKNLRTVQKLKRLIQYSNESPDSLTTVNPELSKHRYYSIQHALIDYINLINSKHTNIDERKISEYNLLMLNYREFKDYNSLTTDVQRNEYMTLVKQQWELKTTKEKDRIIYNNKKRQMIDKRLKATEFEQTTPYDYKAIAQPNNPLNQALFESQTKLIDKLRNIYNKFKGDSYAWLLTETKFQSFQEKKDQFTHKLIKSNIERIGDERYIDEVPPDQHPIFTTADYVSPPNSCRSENNEISDQEYLRFIESNDTI